MKRRICAMVAALMLTSSFCYASEIHKDKIQHIGASAAVGQLMAQNKPFCKWKPWQRVLFNVAMIGGAKELYDHRHSNSHTAEWSDIGADAIGAFGAEGMVWFVHKSF